MAVFGKQGKHVKGAHVADSKSPIEAEDTKPKQDEEPGDEEPTSVIPQAVKPEPAPIPHIENVVDEQHADAPDLEFSELTGLISEKNEAAGYISATLDLPSKKKRKVGKVLGITFGVIAAILLAAYLGGVAFFSSHFLPNTTIGDLDVSLKSSEETEALLSDVASDWTLDVTKGLFAYRLNAPAVNMTVDAPKVVANMHEDLSAWKWPILLIEGAHDEAKRFEVSYSKEALDQQLKPTVDSFNTTAQPPTNASIEYNTSKNAFSVKPETVGTQLDYPKVLAAVEQGVNELAAKLELSDDVLIQPTVFSDNPKLAESAALATGMISADITLNLAGQKVDEVNSDKLSQFITLDAEYNVSMNEEAVNEWLNGLTASYNTVGTERHYTRADGKQIAVSGGAYGWAIDTEALKAQMLEAIKAGAVTTIDVPCSETAATYSGLGNRDWGARYIDVDLAEQHVYFYNENGALIWESDCVSGKPDGEHDTVPGVWYITDKKSPSKLIGYEKGKKVYETTVTYWMPFEGNAIGLHDADWQAAFGGTRYADGYGSHGCVNLPPDKAKELYNLVNPGDVVSCHW